MITKPLLADAVEDIDVLKYPILCTPKLDGIRCLKVAGHVVTRNFKPFPNVFIRTTLEKILPDGIDGEVMVMGCAFNEISSACMSFEGEPNFVYNAFDYVKGGDVNVPYNKRIENLKEWFGTRQPRVLLVLPVLIKNKDELLEYETKCLTQGYEGVMIRSVDGIYKCGRSTVKQGILLKLKRFKDSEAVILGFTEKLSNQNLAEKDEFGHTKRSSKKEGLVAAGTLGNILVKDKKTGVEFSIGSGFNDELKQKIWDNQKDYVGKLVKYKYQEIGQKDLPRFPIFLGFRDKRDM